MQQNTQTPLLLAAIKDSLQTHGVVMVEYNASLLPHLSSEDVEYIQVGAELLIYDPTEYERSDFDSLVKGN